MGATKREQLLEVEGQVNTRQDRNTFLSDGGTWTWNTAAATLTWSAVAHIYAGGCAVGTIAAGNIAGVAADGDVVYVDVDRSGVGGALIVGTIAGSDTSLNSDERLVLGVRGSDGKFYFRNGTVMSDGDSKVFGTLNSSTERNDIASTGAALYNIGLVYAMGTNQLGVYVGGLLQVNGTHYVETSNVEITFLVPYIPMAGETITVLNLIGGQGPAGGFGDLQDAYNNGQEISVAGGTPVDLHNAVPGTVLQQGGQVAATPLWWDDNDGVRHGTAFDLDDDDASTWRFVGDAGELVAYNDASGNAVRLHKTGDGLEFGTYVAGVFTGEGALRHVIFTGVLALAGTTVIPTGLAAIKGMALAVYDGVTGNWASIEMWNAADPAKTLAVYFNAGTGDITIAGDPAGINVGVDFDGEAYQLTVFY